MANHTYTFLGLKTAAHHALKKEPDTQLTSLGEIVNDALQMLLSEHTWAWRLKITTLDSTAGNNNLSALPDDFHNVFLLHRTTTTGSAKLLEEIKPLHAGLLERSHGTYRFHINVTPQANSSSLPTQRIVLYPAPAETTTGFATLIYTRTVARMDSDNDLPDIPSEFHPLLKALVRAHALREDGQEQEAASAWAYYQHWLTQAVRLDNLRYGGLLQQIIQQQSGS